MDKNDINYVFYLVSYNLKRLRHEKGLTQVQFANESNFSESFIANIESKSFQTIGLASVYKFAQVLNVDIRELFRPIPTEAEAEAKHKKNK